MTSAKRKIPITGTEFKAGSQLKVISLHSRNLGFSVFINGFGVQISIVRLFFGELHEHVPSVIAKRGDDCRVAIELGAVLLQISADLALGRMADGIACARNNFRAVRLSMSSGRSRDQQRRTGDCQPDDLSC